ncbi:MAG TPA: delta-aminolevulinic acid dehydratase [Bacteroidales bacterium]|mgnify:CR=1 FL=1|jgi:rhamnogalacturonyl hydrolase YesR|nr:delta-aminolevulinic acid dehydratase [Bacteroidales bacterium]
MPAISAIFARLEGYCREAGYKGWDPYDGLNSRVFKILPVIKDLDVARLAWIQLFKRNPVNLRKLFLVPKGYNPKGVALMLSGYCNLFEYVRQSGERIYGNPDELPDRIRSLADLLVSLRSPSVNNSSAWGYNFDWQARRLFFFPAGTPTVVVTSFCASALFSAYEITKNEEYLSVALSSADFVLNDLHRTPKEKGFLFSYSPLEGNNTVYNASLLGTRLLSQCYHYTLDRAHLEAARESAAACTEAQNSDGSWYYGELPVQQWIDSFHTGYNLEALVTCQEMTGDNSFSDAIEKGFQFYLQNFFLADGTPKYYHDRIYPVDIHSPAQLIVTLCRAGRLNQHRALAEKVLEWTIRNMQDRSGYFYYQKHRFYTNRISYMRWSNAFMFNALTLYILHSAGK